MQLNCHLLIQRTHLMLILPSPILTTVDIFAFGLTAKLSPKAKEDIFDPLPYPEFTEFQEKSNDKRRERHKLT
jgi:hypothetical protein